MVSFRQEILKDFLENETLTQEITDALYQIKALKDYAGSKSVMKNLDYNNLYTLLESLRELAIYVNVSEEIVRCLKKSDIKSRGLIALRDQLDQVVSDEGFETAKKDINAMLEDLSNVRGAIVGVNFTPDLNVEQVSIVEYVPYRIKSKYKFAENSKRQVTELKPETVKDLALMEIVESVADGECYVKIPQAGCQFCY